MGTIWWIAQGVGLIALIFTIFSFFQKEKFKIMLFNSITNASMIAVYALLNGYLAALLVGGALLKSLIYFYFNKRNKKPDTIVPVLFCIYYIVISIVMWDNWMSLLIVLDVLLVTYISWQNNVIVFKIGYFASSLLLLPFDIYIGAYTVALSELALLIQSLVGLPKFTKSSEVAKQIASKYFRANKAFWGSVVTSENGFDLVDSSVADKSMFYNMGILTKYDTVGETIKEIKSKLKKKGLPEIAYMPFDPGSYDELKDRAFFLQMFFPVAFHDTWMKLIDGYNLNDIRCKIDNVKHREVDENNVDDIITTYIKGYHAKNDLKDISENEKLQIEHLKKVDFSDKVVDGFKTHAYLSYYNEQPVCLVCLLSNGKEGYITKVCTLPTFRRKHIASSLMQYAISKERKNGLRNIVLVTDKYSTNEKFYSYNSFVEFAQGFAFDVSNMEKFNHYLKTNEIL